MVRVNMNGGASSIEHTAKTVDDVTERCLDNELQCAHAMCGIADKEH
jgi:hypothetical protein